MPGKVIGECPQAQLGILETAPKVFSQNQIIVSKAVVDMGQEIVPVRILNPTLKARVVYKNTIAAQGEPVEAVIEPPWEAAARVEKVYSLQSKDLPQSSNDVTTSPDRPLKGSLRAKQCLSEPHAGTRPSRIIP